MNPSGPPLMKDVPGVKVARPVCHACAHRDAPVESDGLCAACGPALRGWGWLFEHIADALTKRSAVVAANYRAEPRFSLKRDGDGWHACVDGHPTMRFTDDGDELAQPTWMVFNQVSTMLRMRPTPCAVPVVVQLGADRSQKTALEIAQEVASEKVGTECFGGSDFPDGPLAGGLLGAAFEAPASGSTNRRSQCPIASNAGRNSVSSLDNPRRWRSPQCCTSRHRQRFATVRRTASTRAEHRRCGRGATFDAWCAREAACRRQQTPASDGDGRHGPAP